MKNDQSMGLISGEIIGTNRSLYREVKNIKAELDREIERELRGYRNKKVTSVPSAKLNTDKR